MISIYLITRNKSRDKFNKGQESLLFLSFGNLPTTVHRKIWIMTNQWLMKSVYAGADPRDGCRILVDRLWPRGLTNRVACLDYWARDLAPSTELRRWFGHDPRRWVSFRKKYLGELEDNPCLEEFLIRWGNAQTITLVYAARDRVHNHCRVLRDFLISRSENPGS